MVVNGHESGDYVVNHGLREGSVLSPILYAIFSDEMAKETGATCAGVAIGSTHVKVLTYADNVCDNQ